MLIPCKIQAITKTAEIRASWVVYTHKDAGGVVRFVGVTELADLFYMPDARNNSLWHEYFGKPGDAIEIEAVTIATSAKDAQMEQRRLIGQYQPICNLRGFYVDVSQQGVLCIETGETFESAAECARMHGLTYSALVAHLNRKPGHKTVKGKTYQRKIKVS